jgi:CspA family cold shock protein
MAKGTIKKLLQDRAYGFIHAEEGKDFFFHQNDLRGVNYSSLKEGQVVEFEVGSNRDGRPQAVQVKPIITP